MDCDRSRASVSLETSPPICPPTPGLIKLLNPVEIAGCSGQRDSQDY